MKQDSVKHGTRWTYEGRKCRCDECRAAKSTYAREWRIKKVEEKAYQQARTDYWTGKVA